MPGLASGLFRVFMVLSLGWAVYVGFYVWNNPIEHPQKPVLWLIKDREYAEWYWVHKDKHLDRIEGLNHLEKSGEMKKASLSGVDLFYSLFDEDKRAKDILAREARPYLNMVHGKYRNYWGTQFAYLTLPIIALAFSLMALAWIISGFAKGRKTHPVIAQQDGIDPEVRPLGVQPILSLQWDSPTPSDNQVTSSSGPMLEARKTNGKTASSY